MNSVFGKWLMVAGLIIMITGLVVYFFHDKLSWLGRLPGDIRIEKDNFRFYFPITTMVLISLFLSVLLRIISRFMH
jgi:uncharacterized membrane protein